MAKVLVIDDEPDILFLVSQALRLGGHDVVTSTEPGRIAELALQHGVDAVVLDVMMPEVSGYDALKKLRDEPRTCNTPVLFLSAHAGSHDRIRGLREGADDFLAKPFAVEELILRVERLTTPRTAPTPPKPAITPNLERALSSRKVVGQVFLGRYHALEVIGEGAMGLVFRGWDPRLKRPVALKTLRLDRVLDDRHRHERATQLLNEAVTVARFSHPNIVAVYDVESSPDLTFLALELVEGSSLAAYIDTLGPLSVDHTLSLTLLVARALMAAHKNGVVHHDVKPGNVLLGYDGSVKVTDFGVAQLVSSLVEGEGRVFGTAGYLPPEALAGHGYDERGDLFAVGTVVYECLCGLPAFGAGTVHQRVQRTMRENPLPLAELCPHVPEELSDLVRQLLEKDPRDRPESAEDLVAELESMAGTAPFQAPELGELGRVIRKIGQPSPGFHSTVFPHSSNLSWVETDRLDRE